MPADLSATLARLPRPPECICEFDTECSGGGHLECIGCGGDQCVCAACYGNGETECPGCMYCLQEYGDDPQPGGDTDA